MKIAIDVYVILAIQDWFKIHVKAPGVHSEVDNNGDSFVFHVFNLQFARISEVNKETSTILAV
jgi:hypothetical protein